VFTVTAAALVEETDRVPPERGDDVAADVRERTRFGGIRARARKSSRAGSSAARVPPDPVDAKARTAPQTLSGPAASPGMGARPKAEPPRLLENGRERPGG
jgi:hypothetical protein